VAPSLLRVLEKAMRPERDDRWASAAAMRVALSAAYEESYRSAPEMAAPSEGPARSVSTEGMIYLEGGSFLMGCDDYPDEAPEREVTVDPFYMDRTPVTVAQYALFLEATGHVNPRGWGERDLSGPDQPVVGVSWHDAQTYAEWAGKQLPTEAQWECAARGRDNRKYPWGSLEPDPTIANFGNHFGIPMIMTMHEEGATPDGVQSMGGNVVEWTRDWFTPHNAPAGEDPVMRAVRGGSWRSPADELRCSFRKGLFPETRDTATGFRCVLPARLALETGPGPVVA
jgi:formylglycine-generating enzyme required for sulfatase activity